MNKAQPLSLSLDTYYEESRKIFSPSFALIGKAGMTVTREQLFREVWGEEFMGETRTLDMHVAALREKIKQAGGKDCIVTVRSVGYRFESK